VYRYVQSQNATFEGVTDIYQKEWKDGKGMELAAWWDACSKKTTFQKGQIEVVLYLIPLE
jgi:hypothetical protein